MERMKDWDLLVFLLCQGKEEASSEIFAGDFWKMIKNSKVGFWERKEKSLPTKPRRGCGSDRWPLSFLFSMRMRSGVLALVRAYLLSCYLAYVHACVPERMCIHELMGLYVFLACVCVCLRACVYVCIGCVRAYVRELIIIKLNPRCISLAYILFIVGRFDVRVRLSTI